MSLHLNHVLSTWKVVLVKLRRKSICWQGKALSDSDHLTYTEALVLWMLQLIDISSPYGCLKPMQVYIQFVMQITKLDVAVLGSCLSDCASLLRTVYKPVQADWFKRQLAEEYPDIGRLLYLIDGPLERFLQDPNAEDFTFCYQFFSYLTHLSLVDINIDLEGEYIELETYLHSLSYDPDMMSELNDIMRGWMADFRLDGENYFPCHGPGAVAELPRTASQFAKYDQLTTDQLLTYFVTHYVGISMSDVHPQLRSSWGPFRDTPRLLAQLDRTSVLTAVPKSLKTMRLISKEPAPLIYHQKAVEKVLKQLIASHPYLRHHIDFSKQELNGELALQGSENQACATVDLSSASDIVTLELVKSVFYKTPLYPALLSLRSKRVKLFSGKVLEVAKYAPMGSALCFPVETLIFAAIVEYTVRRTYNKWGYHTPTWRVYGDDIIVEEPCYWDLIDNLKRCGFRVNTAKSYSSPYRFRESCGYEGYDGMEVTPLKISRKYLSLRGPITSDHTSVFEGLIDMANSAYRYQMPLLRAWIIRVLLGNSVGVPLFSSDISTALYSPCPDNYRARFRSRDVAPKVPSRPWFQRDEIRVVMGSTHLIKDESITLDDARYFETLRLYATESIRKHGDMFDPMHRIGVPRGPVSTHLIERWVENPS